MYSQPSLSSDLEPEDVESWIWGVYGTVPFYTKDLSIFGFWYPQESLDPNPPWILWDTGTTFATFKSDTISKKSFKKLKFLSCNFLTNTVELMCRAKI